MRSLSTSAFGQPSETKEMRGAARCSVWAMSVIEALALPRAGGGGKQRPAKPRAAERGANRASTARIRARTMRSQVEPWLATFVCLSRHCVVRHRSGTLRHAMHTKGGLPFNSVHFTQVRCRMSRGGSVIHEGPNAPGVIYDYPVDRHGGFGGSDGSSAKRGEGGDCKHNLSHFTPSLLIALTMVSPRERKDSPAMAARR